jgi:hypothetical protein
MWDGKRYIHKPNLCSIEGIYRYYAKRVAITKGRRKRGVDE